MRLMVLGGGSCQLNLIKRAKAEGHHVTVVDYLDEPPARQYADEHVLASTFDTPSVLAAAQQLRIDAITTLGTDQPVLTAAVASKELGLPFYASPELALAVTNKRVMKKLFTKHGISSCNYRLIGQDFTEQEIKGLSFPAVLKPVDSQGQRGIFLVSTAEQARKHIAETLSFSREDKVLLEEYYASDEITVNGWVTEGRVKILSVVDRVTMKGTNRIGICICHNYPSRHLAKYAAQIKTLTFDIVKAFNIEEGPIYFQFLIGEEGLKVNEIAMRIGGAYEDITLPIICGADVIKLLLTYAENGRCKTDELDNCSLSNSEKYISTQLFFCNPGKIKSITPRQQIMELEGLRAMQYNFREGYEISNINNATARAGYAVIEGRSFYDLEEKINRFYDKTEILDKSNNNLIIAYKDYEEKYLFL